MGDPTRDNLAVMGYLFRELRSEYIGSSKHSSNRIKDGESHFVENADGTGFLDEYMDEAQRINENTEFQLEEE